MQGKRAVVERFMSQYDKIATATIRKHNCDIYYQLTHFLKPNLSSGSSSSYGLQVRGVGGTSGGHQIPCSLVITSNESASSIDTQFAALCTELKAQIQSLNLVIDEKKCGNMKETIEHIQNRLR